MIVRDLLIKLGFSADTAGIDKVETKIGGLKSGVGALSIAAGNVLSNLAQQGLSKAVGVIQDGVDQSQEFGREMANISSLIGGNQARTKELAGAYIDLAKEFGGSAHDIAKGGYELIGSLGDSADHLDRLRTSMILGKAGAGNMAQGFSLLRVATSSYGDTSAAAFKRAADLSAQAVNLGVVTMPQLAGVFGNVAPLASQLGVSMEEAYGSLAAMTSIVEPGEAATQMGAALGALIDRSKSMDAAFKKAFGGEGIKTAKQAIGKYGLQGVLQKVAATTDGTEEAINALFGRKEAMRFTIAMTGNLRDKYREVMEGMKEAGGAAESMAKNQTTGMGAAAFAADKAKAANEALSIEIGKKAEPAMLALGKAALGVKDVFANSFLPMIMGSNGIMDDGTKKTGEFRDALLALQAVGFVVAETFDIIATTIGEAYHLIVAAGTIVHNLLPGGDMRYLTRDIGAQGTAMAELGKGFIERTQARMKVPDVASVQAMQQAAVAPAVAGKASVNMSVGSINTTVNAAPGTEASAVARASDTAARNLIDQLMQNAASSTGPAY